MIMVCVECGAEVNYGTFMMTYSQCPKCQCHRPFIPKTIVDDNTLEGRKSAADAIHDMFMLDRSERTLTRAG